MHLLLAGHCFMIWRNHAEKMKSYFPGFTFESKGGERYKGNVIKLIILYFDENFKENEI